MSYNDDRDNLNDALIDWRKVLEVNHPGRFDRCMEYERLYGFHMQIIRIGLPLS